MVLKESPKALKARTVPCRAPVGEPPADTYAAAGGSRAYRDLEEEDEKQQGAQQRQEEGKEAEEGGRQKGEEPPRRLPKRPMQ